MKNRYIVFLLLGMSLWMVKWLGAAEADSYVYTYEGQANLNRSGKISELKLDMPLKNGDLIKIEPDSWVDYIFFYSIGLRVTGPGDVLAKSVTSLSNIEMKISSGNILIHTENSGEAFQLVLDTPLAIIQSTEPTLTQVLVEPSEKKGVAKKVSVFVKKGRVDATVKLSDSTIRVLENQKIEILPDTFIPPAMGVQPEDLKPAERARTVYVPKKDSENDD